MEQQTPIPQIKDKAAQKAKTRHFSILDLEERGVQISRLFCPRL